jgi:hypothetical protein
MLDLSNLGTFMLCALFALPVFTMIDVAIEQGLAFYCSSLFDQDGTAKTITTDATG